MTEHMTRQQLTGSVPTRALPAGRPLIGFRDMRKPEPIPFILFQFNPKDVGVEWFTLALPLLVIWLLIDTTYH